MVAVVVICFAFPRRQVVVDREGIERLDGSLAIVIESAN